MERAKQSGFLTQEQVLKNLGIDESELDDDTDVDIEQWVGVLSILMTHKMIW
jgi:hypothetical protein